MRLITQGALCLIENVFPRGILAGFTLPEVDGRRVLDDIHVSVNSVLREEVSVSWCTQPHEENISFVGSPDTFPTDGLMTSLAKALLVIRTADCMPVYVYEPSRHTVGILHLGWKSIDKGIVRSLVKMLPSKAKKPVILYAGVGLRKCCYEVKEDFLSTTLAPFVEKKGERYYFDPLACIHTQLSDAGIPFQLYDSGCCTLCHEQRFHSYRRDKTDKRILSFIVKTGA